MKRAIRSIFWLLALSLVHSVHALPELPELFVASLGSNQVLRYDLQTGNLVAGQIRPPKDKERFFALLKVESVDNEDPDKAKDKTHFDNLTPLFPEERYPILDFAKLPTEPRVI